MPKRIDRAEVQELLSAGAQLVEVLPSGEYESEHIRGATNIPLQEIEARAPDELNASKPIVTYCSGSL
jgi:rhodanese-related sulfurtransferase